MKKQHCSKLEFQKMALVELSEPKMAAIIGGTLTIVGGTSLVTLTMQTVISKVER